jgi:hypothetical protein
MNENGAFFNKPGEGEVVFSVAFLWAFLPFLLLSEDLSDVR